MQTRRNLSSKLTGKQIAKKNADGQEINIITHQIDVRPWQRTTQNIPEWRSATQQAESTMPNRVKLLNLYADVDLDGHVEAVTGKRRDAVKTANWAFVDKEGKPIDEINDLIDSIGFGEMLEEIVNSIFWGYSILEPTIYQAGASWEMDPGLLPRLNYRPEQGIIAYDPYSDKGINIREGIYQRTIMEVGRADDLGLYLKAAPYQILKRGGIGDWALFVQVFGNPIVDATWDGFDQTQRQALLDALGSLGAGGALVRPDGTNITLLERSGAANGDLQDKLINRLNKEISKALLGSTETTEASNASGYAQSKTHEGQDETKKESDITFTRRVLNSRFIRIMQSAGIDTKGGHFIVQGEENELTQEQSFNIHKSLVVDMKLPIDDDFWYETYGVPKPENYNELRRQKEEAEPNEPPANDPPKKREEQEEEEVKLSLVEKLISFFVPASKKEAIKTTCCGSHHTIELSFEDYSFDSNAFIQRMYDAQGLAIFDADLFIFTSQALLDAFAEGWQGNRQVNLAHSLGIAYGYNDPALLTAFEQNLFKFSAGKSLAEVQALNELFRKASSFDEFYRMASAKLEVFNKTWLQTEYATALLTGQNVALYNRLVSRSATFPYWQYRTQGDDLVREEHQLLHDIILPWDDPLWVQIFPPNGWNCRCFVVPRMRGEVTEAQILESRARVEQYLASKVAQEQLAQGFGINRALVGQVFTDEQQYTSLSASKASELMNSFNHSNYKLPAYSQAKEAAVADMPTYDQQVDDFFSNLQQIRDQKILRDGYNRPHAISRATAESIDSSYLAAMQQTIQAPAEVWLQGKQLNELVYISYYKDTSLAVVSTIRNGKLELQRVIDLSELQGSDELYRRGLLIKSSR